MNTLISISHAEVMAVKDARVDGRPQPFRLSPSGYMLTESERERETSADAEGGREHPQAVRDILRRAGMSEASELTLDEVKRAREAVSLFRYKRVAAVTIRRHIMPREELND